MVSNRHFELERRADELQRTHQFKECFMWWEDLKMVFGLGTSLADHFVGRIIRLSKWLLYGYYNK